MHQTIAISCDHGGFALKEAIKEKYKNISWLDLGTNSEESVDYPEFGKAMGNAITSGEASTGIVICGSGIGISIAANRFPAVRAALCMTPEMAKLSREHNNANVLALGARLIGEQDAFTIIDTFLNTEFEGGRHERRVEKLGKAE